MATTSITNYQPGARGINMKDGTTVWIEPGETKDIDKAQVSGDLPDFGSKPDPDAEKAAAENVAALTAENEDLKKQVADLTKQVADLTKKS